MDNQFKALVNTVATDKRRKGKYIDLKPIRKFCEENGKDEGEVIKKLFEKDLPCMTFMDMDKYLEENFKL